MVLCKEPPSPLATLRHMLLNTLGQRILRRKEENAMGTGAVCGGLPVGEGLWTGVVLQGGRFRGWMWGTTVAEEGLGLDRTSCAGFVVGSMEGWAWDTGEPPPTQLSPPLLGHFWAENKPKCLEGVHLGEGAVPSRAMLGVRSGGCEIVLSSYAPQASTTASRGLLASNSRGGWGAEREEDLGAWARFSGSRGHSCSSKGLKPSEAHVTGELCHFHLHTSLRRSECSHPGCMVGELWCARVSSCYPGLCPVPARTTEISAIPLLHKSLQGAWRQHPQKDWLQPSAVYED